MDVGVAESHRGTLPGIQPVGGPFDLDVFQDLQNSEQYIVYATQGGLGLPDRDYYAREDEESAELRTKYVSHVASMLHLVGGDAPETDAAEAILALETRLAEASLTNVELRDPANYYNVETVASADGATPRFSWSADKAHDGENAGLIDVDVRLHLSMRHDLYRREVPVVNRFVREPIEKPTHLLLIRRPNGTKPDRGAAL